MRLDLLEAAGTGKQICNEQGLEVGREVLDLLEEAAGDR